MDMRLWVALLILGVLVLVGGGYFLYDRLFPKVKINENAEARIVFIYLDKNIDSQLSSEDSELLREIFNGKRLSFGDSSCGHTEDVSIRFGDLIFCPACDTCPVVKVGNRYAGISQEQREIINQIFEKYGGRFPCV